MSDWNSTWGMVDWSADDGKIIEQIRNLANQGATMNIVDENGDTLLMHAIKNENLKVFNEILTYPQDLNARNKWGRTALIRAASLDETSMVKSLLQKKADPNIQDTDGITATACAAINDNPLILHDLKKEKANLEIKDNNGWTPMMWAISSGSIEAVKELLLYNVPVNDIKNWLASPKAVGVSPATRDSVDSLIRNKERKAKLAKKYAEMNGGR